jgi:hypothetical protein
MRKAIAAAKKAALPPKTKKPRAKKVVDPSSEEKPKKPRAKKSDKTNDLVDQLSALASTPVEITPVEVVVPPTEVSASIPAKKTRTKTTKKTRTVDIPPPPPLDTRFLEKSNLALDDEHDLDVRDFVFDGKQYLIDDSTGNLFDTQTHEHIGIYTSQSHMITFI